MKVVIPAWMKPIYDSYHYAPAVIDGDHLRCSGMIGIRPDLSVPEDLTEQVTLAFENLCGLLAEVGLTFADVTEMTTYHVGLSGQIDRFIAVKDTFVSAPYPAWTAVGISELAIPGAAVEIQITARLS
ncbi:RidA family protein [[Mycobacterium] nativiensis]|uniref:RidA family protein n=1 Tax=[Mycobacterium] nativiensis TaxID=2855503 RepID=A0ABU5XWM2_9MYCO|nr:RidA family protein [Mycolicibacter sp. MYC340]MEB3031391.1 RidA family protein [Mycolicibacter sp. MYC340]